MICSPELNLALPFVSNLALPLTLRLALSSISSLALPNMGSDHAIHLAYQLGLRKEYWQVDLTSSRGYRLPTLSHSCQQIRSQLVAVGYTSKHQVRETEQPAGRRLED